MTKKTTPKNVEGLRSAESKPYSYVPAAITWVSDGGIGIYVRYGKYPDRITVKERGNGYVWVQCPDRELVLVANSHMGWGFRPMQGTFDEYIHVGPYHDHLNADMNLPYFMVNYVAESSKPSAHTRHNTPTGYNPNSMIMADSGGYQILQGRVEYLDPLKIVEWYNDNVDIGFTLDIPANKRSNDILMRAAKIQQRNTDIMMNNKRDGLDIINVLHGATKDYMKYYRELIERPDIDRMAFGSLYHYYDLLESIDLMYEIAHTGQKYKHFHVLGVGNSLHVALLIRMATQGLMPNLTSDSSTPMQKARLREWHMFTSPMEKVKYSRVGYKDGYRPSTSNILPCSCQVCSAVKYSDVLWCLNGNIAHKVFEFHNAHSMNRYFDALTKYSYECTTKDFQDLLKVQVGENRQGFEEAMSTIDFIDTMGRGKVDAARSKYQIYLGSGIFGDIPTREHTAKGMFDDVDDYSEGDSDPDDFTDIERLLQRYESEDTSRFKHGRKLKTEVANTRSTKNTSGGKNLKPLTASQLKKQNVEKSRSAKSKATLEEAPES